MTPRPELKESEMLIREPEEKKETDAEFGARLSAPFPEHEVEWRPGGGGMELAYVTARAVQERLDDVAGPDGWETDLRELAGGKGFICRLSIRYPSGWRHREDGSDNSDIEAIKGGMSGAQKRVGVQHGIGRYLYWLPKGRQRTLPPWALPGGSGRPPAPGAKPAKPAPKPRTPAKPKMDPQIKIKAIMSLVEKAESRDGLNNIWNDYKAFIEALPEKDRDSLKQFALSRKADLEAAVAQ